MTPQNVQINNPRNSKTEIQADLEQKVLKICLVRLIFLLLLLIPLVLTWLEQAPRKDYLHFIQVPEYNAFLILEDEISAGLPAISFYQLNIQSRNSGSFPEQSLVFVNFFNK